MIAKARKPKRDRSLRLTCIIRAERGGFSSLCPELDVASQGDTVENARESLIEALELFFETASPSEVKRRLEGDFYVSSVEVRVG